MRAQLKIRSRNCENGRNQDPEPGTLPPYLNLELMVYISHFQLNLQSKLSQLVDNIGSACLSSYRYRMLLWALCSKCESSFDYLDN